MTVETIRYKGFNINIETDDCPQDPRDNDNLGIMVCHHKRASLGDETNLDFNSDEELADYLLEECDADPIAMLPLYLYQHSGMTISTTPFSCPWDSGQVGWIYVTKKRIMEEWGQELKKDQAAFQELKVGEKGTVFQTVMGVLQAEVEEYDNYLTGAVYGYEVQDDDGNEIDACWGFYGTDYEKSGLMEYAKNAIECEIKNRAEEAEKQRQYKQKQVKIWIKKRLGLELRNRLNMHIV